MCKTKEINLSLESKVNDANVELEKVKKIACKQCQEHESKIVELNQVIKKYEKGQIGLKNVLSRQRYSNKKNEFGFSNFNKPSTNKPIFVKSSTTSNNVEPKKLHVVNPPKRSNVRNNSYCRNYSNVRNNSYGRNYSNFRNNSYNRNYSNNSYDKNNSYVHHVHKPTCFYCNTKGHTLNPLYIRNYGVSYREHVWVEKGFN